MISSLVFVVPDSERDKRRWSRAGLLSKNHDEVDAVAHCGVAGPVRVQLVAGAAGGGVGLIFRLQLSGLRVERDGIEVDHAVEDVCAADEVVVLLPLRFDFGRAVSGRAVERAGQRRHVDAHTRDALAQALYALAHAIGYRLRGGAGGAEVVDPLALQPIERRWSAWNRLGRIVRRTDNLVAADALVHDREATAGRRMQAA